MLAIGIVQFVVCGLRALRCDRRAVTSVEYALIAVIIVVAIVGGVTRLGNGLAVSFNSVASEF